uniref:Piwi domain-containing protein n=1 Tax=Panagrellus redivivus TaxID=6233 RepID=A0A7E4V7A5_PANRE
MAVAIRDELDFPGTEGRPLQIRTNLFPINRQDEGLEVGVYMVEGVRILHAQPGGDRRGRGGPPRGGGAAGRAISSEPIPIFPNELFDIFCRILDPDLGGAGRIPLKGYSTRDDNTMQIFVIPPIPQSVLPLMTPRLFHEVDKRRGKVVGNINMTVKYLRNVDFYAMQVYNDFRELMKTGLIESLAMLFKNQNYIQIGNNLFTLQGKKSIYNVIDVLGGMKVRIHTEVLQRPMLSINMTFATCLRVTVPLLYVYLALIIRRDISEIQFRITDLPKDLTLSGGHLEAFRQVVKGLDIQSHEVYNRTHQGRYKVTDITTLPASKIRCKDRQATPLNEYFISNGYDILLPHMNAVEVKRGAKTYSIPMEHCFVSDTPQKLRHSMTLFKRDIIALTAIPPEPRFQFIDKIGRELSHCLAAPDDAQRTLLTDLNMRIDAPISMEARVLDQPATHFKEKPNFLAMPYTRKKVQYIFFNLATTTPFLYGPPPVKSLEGFIYYLYERLNIDIDWRDMLYAHDFQRDTPLSDKRLLADFTNKIQEVLGHLRDGNISYYPEEHQLIFFVLLPDEAQYDTAVLRGTGKAMLTSAGFVSQFFRPENFIKLNTDAIRFHVAMKVNAKLGGINNIPIDSNLRWNRFLEIPTMFVGIDTRNSTERNQRGIVAVSASCNVEATQYAFYRRRNHLDSRYSINWTGIIDDALRNFHGPFPERVFILRAGMDEHNLAKGEAMSEIYEIEVVMENYCYSIGKPRPKITYIGYNRAHNIRFMRDDDILTLPVDPEYRNDDGLRYNVPRGTVVDHQITHRSTFYMVTHTTNQGTVKPVKYIITKDDNFIVANDLLSVLYTLCCLTPRTNFPIRRPLPIAYCSLLLDHTVDTLADPYADAEIDRPINIHRNLKAIPFFV